MTAFPSPVPCRQAIALPPGVFKMDATVQLPPFTDLVGAGPGRTIIQLNHEYDGILANSGNVSVESLTIDCNARSRIGFLGYGSNMTVRNVEVINHISPPGLESFAILMDASSPDPRYNLLIENCTVRDFLGGYNGGLGIAGLGLIVNGVVRASRYIAPLEPSKEQVGPGVGVIGAPLIEGCTMENVTTGIYTEGMESIIVRGCTFLNVRGNALRINLIRNQQMLSFTGNQVVMAKGAIPVNWIDNSGPVLANLVVERNDIFCSGKCGSGTWSGKAVHQLVKAGNNVVVTR
jgi:hypothetical protein